MKIFSLESDPIKLTWIHFWACIFLVLCAGVSYAQAEVFRDSENCLLCHRYPMMGRYDHNGKQRIYYVNGREYTNSVHGELKCTDCHSGLDKIPHADIKKVDCSRKCHISGGGHFSHKDIAEKIEGSVHSRGTDQGHKPFPEDLPTCSYCHKNRDHFSGEGHSAGKMDLAEVILSIFRHPQGQLRSQIDVVRLCSSCHEDRYKMARHGIESIETYKDTFHWQALKYGVVNAPDCISCHVPLGYSSHSLRPINDPLSPVNMANRVKTCSSGGGMLTCHPDATAGFAEGRVHKYGMKARLLTGEKVFNVEDRFKSLMIVKAGHDIPREEIFHYNVLKVLRLIYKILIGGTIGFMSVHQLLDYIRTKKSHKKSH